jgi:hypothetical protein
MGKKAMRAELQDDFALHRTGNYFDMVEGDGYHLQPITFNEFLSKPESLFMYDDSFFQIPGYIQESATIKQIEDSARRYVVDYIMNEFDHNLLGMQDYVRWATKFEHRCASLASAFWSQVNMHDLMLAKDLEMDDNEITRTGTANAKSTGGGTTTIESKSTTDATGKQSTTQDIENKQLNDGYQKTANATVVNASGQLGSNDIDYDWSEGADNVQEVRTRAGDTSQHTKSQTDSESNSATIADSTSTQSMNNSGSESTNTGKELMSLTNKMFMQERQWAIDTARQLLPLDWLRQALRPMFYMIY